MSNMLYKYPSEKKMHYCREHECYFDYIVVEGDSHPGYSKTMKEAKNGQVKKTVKRKPRKKQDELD